MFPEAGLATLDAMVEKIGMHRPRRFVLAFALALSVPTSLSLLGCGETERPDGGTGLLAAGADAPDLSTTAHDGTAIALRSLGKPAVVYFYPKDDTPGCTKEACGFRDAWTELRQLGVEVLGVSPDSADSHARFAEKYRLPFRLLSDPDKHEKSQSYEEAAKLRTWIPKGMEFPDALAAEEPAKKQGRKSKKAA